MTAKEFFDKFDRGEWEQLHYDFLDHVAPSLREKMWRSLLERAATLIQLLSLPEGMLTDDLLPERKPEVLSSYDIFSALMRLQGIDASQLSAKEAIAFVYLQYELRRPNNP